MKQRIKAFLKRNKIFYRMYSYIGSFLLRVLGLFIQTDPDLILFISYGGQKYDDSPRVVYEYLQKHPVSDKHKYVWAFVDPSLFPQIENAVKVDTLSYYLTAMKAGYWITNSSAARGLNIKKAKTKNVLFTHGLTAIKKIGADIAQSDKAFRPVFQEKFDYIFVEGKKEIPIISHAWGRDEKLFRQTGLPRNDDLAHLTPEECAEIKAKLGIPQNKKVILYAPTFRESSRDSGGLNALGLPFDFARWKAELGDDYVILVTAHYEVAKLLDELPTDSFVYNAFKYPVLNDLLKISDILISDYSSVVFDFAILERPIFCYGYDYETYLEERGTYTDLESLFLNGVLKTEEQLLSAIQTMDYEAHCRYTKQCIKEEYIAAYGNAAENALHIIFPKE